MSSDTVWETVVGLEVHVELATETKLSAENFSDLGEVIRLCESAMEKGLDEGNLLFAKQLLAATLVQRADVANNSIFRPGPVDPKWRDYRRLALSDLEKAVKLLPEEPEALVLIAKLNFPRSLPAFWQSRWPVRPRRASSAVASSWA